MSANPADAMPFSKLMGVQVTTAEKDRVAGSLFVGPEICTVGGVIHGGAVMAFADALAGIGGFLNLPAEAGGTATIECKTNFLSIARKGTTVTAESVPMSVGRRLSVWLTTIRDEDGKSIAGVTQTQMAL